MSITPEVLQRFKLKSEDLGAMANPPTTWVELAVLHVVGRRRGLSCVYHVQSLVNGA